MSRARVGRRARTPGFTLFELLTVMVLIAILSGIAVPILRGAVARADAARVSSDANTVRLAAFHYLADHGSLPPVGDWGELPPELVGYLPEGFAFAYKVVEYAWSVLEAGAPGGAASGFPTLRVWAYTAVVPAGATGTSPAQGQGQGKGQGKGLGGDTGEEPPAPVLTGTVGVLWVRYPADDPIAEALQALAGASGFWTSTQMMFILGG